MKEYSLGRVKTVKRRQCSDQQCVGHETRFSKDNWESMYCKIFWESWNWRWCSTESFLNWFRGNLVVRLSSLAVKPRKSTSRYFLIWKWRHVGTWHWSFMSEHTNYENSPASGSKIQHAIISHYALQHRMNGWLSTLSWKSWGHSDIGPCGCWGGIRSDSITLLRSTITCSIIWMASRELWLTRRLNGTKTCSLLWS